MKRLIRQVALAAMMLPNLVCGLELQSGLYVVESRMVLPHLDEMRRIVETRDICVRSAESLLDFFPVSQQPAMIGCRLVPLDHSKTDFVLRCDAINGAEGHASLQLGASHIKGRLEAKMGGKNMTFSQLIKARRRGNCN